MSCSKSESSWLSEMIGEIANMRLGAILGRTLCGCLFESPRGSEESGWMGQSISILPDWWSNLQRVLLGRLSKRQSARNRGESPELVLRSHIHPPLPARQR